MKNVLEKEKVNSMERFRGFNGLHAYQKEFQAQNSKTYCKMNLKVTKTVMKDLLSDRFTIFSHFESLGQIR